MAPTITIPRTSHVRAVLDKADEVGLELVEVEPARGGEVLSFRKAHHNMRVTFDQRGYIRQAGGASPRTNSWVISVSNERHFRCTPKRALEVLIDHTMPEYAKGDS